MHEEPNYGYWTLLAALFLWIIYSEIRGGKTLKRIAKEFSLAFIVIFIIRSFVVDIFQIPSGSMVNNLLVGDIPIVKKYSYGYRTLSLWLSELVCPKITNDTVWFENSPKRGDIFVFRLPTDPSVNFVKRVVGLPGDKIQLINGDVYINDIKIERKPTKAFTYEDDNYPGVFHYMDEFEEQFPGEEKPHKIIMVSDDYLENLPIKNYVIAKRNTEPYYVPEGHYFGMGDNRDFSDDCRNSEKVGFIHKRYIIGQAFAVVLSMAHRVKIYEFWKWLQNFRYDRFFKLVQ